METVYGKNGKRNGNGDEKEDVTDESYGIVCIVNRADYIGNRICMNLVMRRGGQTLVW